MPATEFPEITVLEKTSATYLATVTDSKGTAIPSSSLLTLTLQIYDLVTSTVIRPEASVLNVNGGTVDSSGNFEMEFAPGDNVILNPGLEIEKHVALFKWTYPNPGGSKSGAQEVIIQVENLEKVT